MRKINSIIKTKKELTTPGNTFQIEYNILQQLLELEQNEEFVNGVCWIEVCKNGKYNMIIFPNANSNDNPHIFKDITIDLDNTLYQDDLKIHIFINYKEQTKKSTTERRKNATFSYNNIETLLEHSKTLPKTIERNYESLLLEAEKNNSLKNIKMGEIMTDKKGQYFMMTPTGIQYVNFGTSLSFYPKGVRINFKPYSFMIKRIIKVEHISSSMSKNIYIVLTSEDDIKEIAIPTMPPLKEINGIKICPEEIIKLNLSWEKLIEEHQKPTKKLVQTH